MPRPEQLLAQFADVQAVPTRTPNAQAWTARENLPDGRTRLVLIKSLPDTAPTRARATHALALSHKSIVLTRRWVRDAGQVCVVRDFTQGENLQQWTQNAARRAFDRLLALLSPIVDAVSYAQNAGLPHGGVSPENVIIDAEGRALLSDFAPAQHGSRFPQAPPDPARADLWGVCELFKTLLPSRPKDDEAGQRARLRLLKNLEDAQAKADTPDALRESLEAIGQMADLLGFSSRAEGQSVGPRLLWAIQPDIVTLKSGAGAGLALSLSNTGDADLPVDAVSSDAVWLNPYERFAPFTLAPAARRDVLWVASGARLTPGRYEPRLLIVSDGVETSVPLVVDVLGEATSPPKEAPAFPQPEQAAGKNDTSNPAIAVTQQPDPAITSLGQNGVVHLAVQNVGTGRIRLDSITPSPAWLVYPGEFRGVWIEPERTEYLGFSVVGASLPGGDFKAEVLFGVSVLAETLVGPEPVRREMTCDVRVRVVRGALDADKAAEKAARGAGCGGTAVLLIAGAIALAHALSR